MIVSRLLPLGRRGLIANGKRFSSSHKETPLKWYEFEEVAPTYRSFAKSPVKNQVVTNCMGTFMWWWIFYHIFTEYEHMIGHHHRPSASIWSDEELGIPADDEPDSPV